MSKRKKTTTTKNTTTKVKLIKTLTALDKKHLLSYVNETGVIGAAYKIIYSVNDGDGPVMAKELCAKSIRKIDEMLSNAAQFNFNTEEEKNNLQNATNSLVHDFVNKQLASQFDGMDDRRVSEILFSMLTTYVFLTEKMQKYCEANKDNRVGIIVVYECEYNTVEDSLTTKLNVVPIGSLEKWMEVSTEFLAADNATILKEA